jgi:anti-sigma factor RsiW
MIGAREGELSDAQARALEAHLAGCVACRAIAADAAATEGLVSEALLARANERDFAPFVDEVMARVARRERRGLRAWLSLHRRAAAAALVPVVAALAVIVYVRVDGGREPMALLELSSEGEVTTVLQTVDGPVVLLVEDAES